MCNFKIFSLNNIQFLSIYIHLTRTIAGVLVLIVLEVFIQSIK